MFMPPDPDDRREMWIVLNLVGSLAKANGTVFVSLLILLAAYVFVRILIRAIILLYEIYRERLAPTSPHAPLFRKVLAVAIIVGLFGLAAAVDPETRFYGITVLWNDFFLLSFVTVVLDWYLDRDTPAPAPKIDELTLDQFVLYQNKINAAHDAGLVTKGP